MEESHKGARIAIIGAGNVAWHLSQALANAGCEIAQVCSRGRSSAEKLADRLGQLQMRKPEAADVSVLSADLDFYLIAVADDAIAGLVQSMPKPRHGIVAHTSGSVPMSALSAISPRHGVFYPLQTFSKEREVNMAEVPFFTEASDGDALARLDKLAALIGGSVGHASSQQRGILHLAAVFACNFTNHLWGIASDILRAEGYGLKVFEPLLRLTMQKALEAGDPHSVQTGPAAREDYDIMAKHMRMLGHENAEIYKILSQSIINTRS